MTMVPSQTHHLNKVFCYGGCGGEIFGYDQFNHSTESGFRSEFLAAPMAEDGSRTNVDLNHGNSNSREANDQEKDEGWLKLRVGSSAGQRDEPVARRGSTMVELDLLPGGSSKLGLEQDQTKPSLLSPRLLHLPIIKSPIWPIANSNSIPSSSNFMPPPSLHFNNSSSCHQQEINWAFMPFSHDQGTIPSSSSSSSFIQMSSYFSGPPLIQTQTFPGSDFRVIDPPRRPHSGIWFTLQASEHQAREPFLPQLSKSYLRIKDGRMTVRLVMKYLANKLRLEDESELEMRCRGEKVMPLLTLQHVRDKIWGSRNGEATLLPNSPCDSVMVLHYCRAPLPDPTQ